MSVVSLSVAALLATTSAGAAEAPPIVPTAAVALAPGPQLASADVAAMPPASTPASAPATSVAPVASERPWYTLSDMKHLGLQLDVGAPGAAGASLVFRPWWWLRFNGGLAYDYIGFGVRGGVSLVPVHWAVTPTLNFDYGHFMSGDATKFSSNATPAEAALLRNATYDFASAQVGLEFGSQRSFTFYLRGGLSYISAAANGGQLSALANEKNTDPTLSFAFNRNASISAIIPCASLGVLFYVY